MNLQHLRYAVEVARSGSITKSAENLYMAQPNLSSALKELEAELGIQVFKRTPRGVEVTPEGAEFLSYAQHVIDEMENLEFRYKNQRNRLCLRFATVRSSNVSHLFCDFINQLPHGGGFQVQLKETTNFGVVEAVAAGEADVGRLHFSPAQAEYFASAVRSKGLVMELLWKVGNYVLMSESHPLAGQQSVTVEQLKPYIEVLHADFANSQFTYQFLKERQGLPFPERTVYVYDRGTLNDVLSNCTGTYLWTMSTHPDVIRNHRLKAVPCLDAEYSTIEAVIYPKAKPRSKEAQWIIDNLKGMRYAESFLHQQPLEKETVL